MTNKTAKSPEPSLQDILAKQEASAAERKAKLEALRAEEQALLEAEEAEREANQKLLDEQLAAVREQRDSLLEQLADAKTARAEAIEPIKAKHEKARANLEAKQAKEMSDVVSPHDSTITDLQGKLDALTAEVFEKHGVPEVVFNMDIAPAPSASKPAGSKATERKTIVVADLGILGPYLVSTVNRRQSGDKITSVVYETRENEAGEVELCSRRVDKDGVVQDDLLAKAKAGDYTHCSTRASVVTTNPGFQPTTDVLYALGHKAGIMGQPRLAHYTPQTDPSDIFVDGEPLAATSAPAEVTIEETV